MTAAKPEIYYANNQTPTRVYIVANHISKKIIEAIKNHTQESFYVSDLGFNGSLIEFDKNDNGANAALVLLTMINGKGLKQCHI